MIKTYSNPSTGNSVAYNSDTGASVLILGVADINRHLKEGEKLNLGTLQPLAYLDEYLFEMILLDQLRQ